ncbi:mechanosensitive ion channel family protein [Desulfallas thermosapovorans]|uniref:Small conductance mechanosensitive channel n=1 Tax=Desulfallas thermosapovorans DSM 6562 TaxID=1121431 RepID=A0A5S4ZV67_9FIRM|nr:mechanosensitive ion channel family protein [Desulfallas thermosapovorans]TYO96853.1 small conductance mechanosensitive channel [Desulfallas thermosapovorans DSM 6562]
MGIILFITYLLLKLRVALVNKIFDRATGDLNKANTLKTLLLSGTRYVIYIVAVLTMLAVFEINITPMLASAGIVGLAVGFGAQNLVKDIITGFFIMFEDQFHVGDFIEVNDQVAGTVEELGLRLTTIREWSGKKFYIANSEIKTVRNYNRGHLRTVVSVAVPFEENLQRVFGTLERVCRHITGEHADKLIKQENGSFVEPPQIYGITDINKDERGVVFTVIAVVEPAYYWFLEREFRRVILEYFQDAGIALAYPQINIKTARGFEPAVGSS